MWNLLDISTSHEYANVLPKLGSASWFLVCCAIPPTNIYRVKLYTVGRRGRANTEKLMLRRGGTHTHKRSDKWHFTVLYYCTYKSEC